MLSSVVAAAVRGAVLRWILVRHHLLFLFCPQISRSLAVYDGFTTFAVGQNGETVVAASGGSRMNV
jgi:hypothetical protein